MTRSGTRDHHNHQHHSSSSQAHHRSRSARHQSRSQQHHQQHQHRRSEYSLRLHPGDDEFSFISPCVKYSLFLFNLIFWVSYLSSLLSPLTSACPRLSSHL